MSRFRAFSECSDSDTDLLPMALYRLGSEEVPVVYLGSNKVLQQTSEGVVTVSLNLEESVLTPVYEFSNEVAEYENKPKHGDMFITPYGEVMYDSERPGPPKYVIAEPWTELKELGRVELMNSTFQPVLKKCGPTRKKVLSYFYERLTSEHRITSERLFERLLETRTKVDRRVLERHQAADEVSVETAIELLDLEEEFEQAKYFATTKKALKQFMKLLLVPKEEVEVAFKAFLSKGIFVPAVKENETEPLTLETPLKDEKTSSDSAKDAVHLIRSKDPLRLQSRSERLQHSREILSKIEASRDKNGCREFFGKYAKDEEDLVKSFQENTVKIAVGTIDEIKQAWPKIESLKEHELMKFAIKSDDKLSQLCLKCQTEGIYLQPPKLTSLLTQEAKINLAMMLNKRPYQVTDLDVEVVIRDARFHSAREMSERRLIDIIKQLQITSGAVEDVAYQLIANMKMLIDIMLLELRMNNDKHLAENVIECLLSRFPDFIRKQEFRFWKEEMKHKKNISLYLDSLKRRLVTMYRGIYVKKRREEKKKEGMSKPISLLKLAMEEMVSGSDGKSDSDTPEDLEKNEEWVGEDEILLSFMVNEKKCFLCKKSGHSVMDCPDAKNMTILEKRNFIRKMLRRNQKFNGQPRNRRYLRDKRQKPRWNKPKQGWNRHYKRHEKKKWNHEDRNNPTKEPIGEVELNYIQQTMQDDLTKELYHDDLCGEITESSSTDRSSEDSDASEFGEISFNVIHLHAISKAKTKPGYSTNSWTEKLKFNTRLKPKKMYFTGRNEKFDTRSASSGCTQYIPDTGCIGVNIIGKSLGKQAIEAGAIVTKLEKPYRVVPGWNGNDKKAVIATMAIRTDVVLETDGGKLQAADVCFYVLNINTPLAYIGEKFHHRFGIPTQNQLFAQAAKRLAKPGITLNTVEPVIPKVVDSPMDFRREAKTFFNAPLSNDVEKALAEAKQDIAGHTRKLERQSPEIAKQFRSLMLKYANTFRRVLIKDDGATIDPYDIELRPEANTAEFLFPGFKYSLPAREFLNQEIERFVQAGMLRKVTPSHRASPIMVLKKKSGKFRMVVNLSKSNQYVKKQSAVPIDFQTVRNAFIGSTIFCVLDLVDGYWQVKVGPTSQKWYRLRSHNAEYESTRLLQGSTNGSIIFQDLANRICGKYLMKRTNGAIAYMDDLILYAEGVGNMFQVLQHVLQNLTSLNLKVKLQKCDFFKDKVNFLGYEISKTGIAQPLTRTSALTSLKPPKTAGMLTKFIGSLTWIHKFLGPRYSEIIAPLLDARTKAAQSAGTLKKKKLDKIDIGPYWGKEQSKAWNDILKLVSKKCHTLSTPDPDTQDLNVFTDASDEYYGGMLTSTLKSQRNVLIQKRDHKAVGFHSGQFKASQKNWSVIDKEAYGLISTIESFATLIDSYAAPFSIYTDHRNLTYLYNPELESTNKTTIGRVTRWSFLLQRFQYIIKHISGETNLMADLLSRIEPKIKAREAPIYLMSTSLVNVFTTNLMLERLKAHNPLTNNEPLPRVRKRREVIYNNGDSHDSNSDNEENAPTLDDKPNTSGGDQLSENSDKQTEIEILYNPQPLVPDGNKKEIISIVHGWAHNSPKTMVKMIEENPTVDSWPTVLEDARKHYQRCRICQETKKKSMLRPTMRGWFPNHVVRADYLRLEPGKNGLSSLLVLKDDFSLYCMLFPIATEDHRATIHAIQLWAANSKFPELLITDKGSHFAANIVREYNKYAGTTVNFSIGKESNGSIERLNRSVIKLMKALLHDLELETNQWETIVPLVQNRLNNSPSDTLNGYAPIELFMGQSRGFPFRNAVGQDYIHMLPIGTYDEHVVQIHREMDKKRRYALMAGEKKRAAVGKLRKTFMLEIRSCSLKIDPKQTN